VRRSLEELDIIEQALEAREDALTLRRYVEPETPALLREAAEVNRQEALVQLERARVLESRARLVEREVPRLVARGAEYGGACEAPAAAVVLAGRAPSARTGGLPAAAPRAAKVARPSDTRHADAC
jgi:hypothetical protein